MAVALLTMEKLLPSGSFQCHSHVTEAAESRLGKLQPEKSSKLEWRQINCAGMSRQDLSEMESFTISRDSHVSTPAVAENNGVKETRHSYPWTRLLKSSLVGTSLAVSLLLHPQPDASTVSFETRAPVDVAIESIAIGLGIPSLQVSEVNEVALHGGYMQVNWVDWEPQTELKERFPIWLGGSLGWKAQEADEQSYGRPLQEPLKTQTAFLVMPVEVEDDDEDTFSLDSFPEGLGFCPMWHNSRLETTVPLGPVAKALPPGLKWPASFEAGINPIPDGEISSSTSPEVPTPKRGSVKRLGAMRVGINKVTPVWEVLVGGCFSL